MPKAMTGAKAQMSEQISSIGYRAAIISTWADVCVYSAPSRVNSDASEMWKAWGQQEAATSETLDVTDHGT